MKSKLFTVALLLLFIMDISAQEQNQNFKKYQVNAGIGYFNPQLKMTGEIKDFTSPKIGFGFSYFGDINYFMSKKLSLGFGFNGGYAFADFIKDIDLTNVGTNGREINGYLDAGAIFNFNIVVNSTYYFMDGDIRPYGKLSLGLFIQQVELGDIPTDITTLELFPDFKAITFGIIPEIGVKYKFLTFGIGYTLPFGKLTSETIPGITPKKGDILSTGIQINVGFAYSFDW